MSQIKVEIIVPLYYNDGSSIEDEKFIRIYDKIIERFDACSIDNSVTKGGWKHPITKEYYEDESKTLDNMRGHARKSQIF